jgi:hypothetical protein
LDSEHRSSERGLAAHQGNDFTRRIDAGSEGATRAWRGMSYAVHVAILAYAEPSDWTTFHAIRWIIRTNRADASGALFRVSLYAIRRGAHTSNSREPPGAALDSARAAVGDARAS